MWLLINYSSRNIIKEVVTTETSCWTNNVYNHQVVQQHFFCNKTCGSKWSFIVDLNAFNGFNPASSLMMQSTPLFCCVQVVDLVKGTAAMETLKQRWWRGSDSMGSLRPKKEWRMRRNSKKQTCVSNQKWELLIDLKNLSYGCFFLQIKTTCHHIIWCVRHCQAEVQRRKLQVWWCAEKGWKWDVGKFFFGSDVTGYGDSTKAHRNQPNKTI